MSRVKFMNIEIDNLTMNETLQRIDALVKKKKNSYIVTPNVDHIMQLQKDKELKEIYDNADLILTDGKPLIWIGKYYGITIKEKISGSDLFPLLCELAAKRNYKMFFLGAAEGVASEAARKLKKRYKGLNVVGTYSPPYGFVKDELELEKIYNMLNESKPDILIVGLGCPKQEKFIYRSREKYNIPVSIGLGASLDFEAGNIKRAPRWMSNIGLEWLYRITQDPKRMLKRYLLTDLKIFFIMGKYKK